MRPLRVVLLTCCVAHPLPALGRETERDSEDRRRFACATLLAQLRADLRKEASHAIPLGAQGLLTRDENADGASAPCEDFQRAKQALRGPAGPEIERGVLGGRRAAVLSDGPHGSGHYWQLAGRYGEKYAALAKMREDLAPDLHRAAAAAYRAFATGADCPP